jgi:2-haloacid dehalogenase
MAKRAGLPWDAILGAEAAHAYKPQPEAYDRTAAFLDLKPAQCMMVAAHNGDLMAARGRGFRTAFVSRRSSTAPTRRGMSGPSTIST